jgi:hypothetical protein
MAGMNRKTVRTVRITALIISVLIVFLGLFRISFLIWLALALSFPVTYFLNERKG